MPRTGAANTRRNRSACPADGPDGYSPASGAGRSAAVDFDAASRGSSIRIVIPERLHRQAPKPTDSWRHCRRLVLPLAWAARRSSTGLSTLAIKPGDPTLDNQPGGSPPLKSGGLILPEPRPVEIRGCRYSAKIFEKRTWKGKCSILLYFSLITSTACCKSCSDGVPRGLQALLTCQGFDLF